MYMSNDTWLKKTKLFLNGQVFKFMIVGLTCASLEFSIFHVLHLRYGIDYLTANVVSVIVAIFVNYFLSRKFVFQRSKHSVTFEVSTFVVFSVAAIVLNHLILWFLVEIAKFEQIGLCKAVTIILVAVFNFVTKKHIVFKNK